MKKYINFSKYIAVLASVLVLLLGCTSSTDIRSGMDKFSLNEIIGCAMDDGEVNSLSMPDEWANWEDTWSDIKLFYNIEHTDTDMGSAEVLDAFSAFATDDENGGDIGDVSYVYAHEAEKQGLTLKYKTTYWDEIPSWAKDDDGDWIVCYTGSLAFLINNDIVSEPPDSWEDILKGDYKVGISDVINGSLGKYSVYAAAIAMGGSSENIEPGIQYFRTLAEQGRLVYNMNDFDDFMDNDIGVQMKWDFTALNYRDLALEFSKPVNLSACIPSDGSLTTGFASIINANAANPFAAALAREYILSDAGQMNLVNGYATPIRSVVIPEEMVQKRIPSDQYTDEMSENAHKYSYKIGEKIVSQWTDTVMSVLTASEGGNK